LACGNAVQASAYIGETCQGSTGPVWQRRGKTSFCSLVQPHNLHKSPEDMKHLNQTDCIYYAGFLDGDGSIIAQLVLRQDYKFKFQIRLTLQFTQLRKRR